MQVNLGYRRLSGGWGRNEVKPPAIREQRLHAIQRLMKNACHHAARWGLGYALVPSHPTPATQRQPPKQSLLLESRNDPSDQQCGDRTDQAVVEAVHLQVLRQ